MDDGVVAHVDCHMSAVADDISGLCLGKTANCVSGASLLPEVLGRLMPKCSYTLMTKPEQSVPFVRLVPPYTYGLPTNCFA